MMVEHNEWSPPFETLHISFNALERQLREVLAQDISLPPEIMKHNAYVQGMRHVVLERGRATLKELEAQAKTPDQQQKAKHCRDSFTALLNQFDVQNRYGWTLES